MKEQKIMVEEIKKAIHEANGNIRLATLANICGYSEKHMDRVFKTNVGITIKKYADRVRIEKAKELIKSNRMDEIIEMLGYYDQSHFIKSFKGYTRVTPRAYKERML